ncbi:hypothetical protein FNV43_RR08829 [Rhamnella rubrinervis]|uniref:Leucine-rich repeat-containing N-terminal plant-type domain-containing protein n=1 Tax=Rhamnella rubrinervis TaxID=2594499 RepID=A0A8K0H9I1_9ROSA|nr:hypothetical protein FNV43_RR08829 [Rhamnella rubrinervis]
MTSCPTILCLLFVFFYSTLFYQVVVSSGGRCLSDQQSLLLQFKNALIFNAADSKSLVRWNQSSDCCTWEGISCEKGRVTGLKLSNEWISGGINDNSTLFNLRYLQSLDLSYNLISSTIPSGIGNLINLRYLNFSGEFGGQIPQEISHLKKLLILDLSLSYGLEIPNLRMVVQNLTKLEELYLDFVNISAPGNEWGQAISSSFPNLRVLSLSECGLSGPIHHSLAKLQHLSVIDLSYNYRLSSPVPRFFGNFSNLTSLRLAECGLHGTFPKEMFQVPTLRILDISLNGFLESSLPEFPPHSDLQILDISFTNFKGRLPSSIGNLRQLTALCLSICLFSGPLPKSIEKLTQLVYLDLSYNQFVGPIPSLDMTRNLEGIDLSHNRLSGPIPSFDMTRNLERIDLSDNRLSGPIPSFDMTRNLERIDLSDNRLSGPIPSFDMTRNLEGIDLSHNRLSGPIPSFDMTKNLKEMDLSYNLLSGPIPSAHLEGLLNISYIDLHSNSFNGNIPSSLFTLPLLKRIELSYNQFSGQVLEFPNPPSSMLEIIDLSGNKLQGPIPMSIFKLRELNSLSLSSNMFNGTIHLDSFQSLTSLVSLNLSYNNISINVSGNGSNIPFLPKLSVLLLGSCNLRKFPEIFKNHTELSDLDLSNNQIYGEIPNWIWKLGNGSLYSLNLSHNQLVGIQEPYSLYNIDSVDLSFNQIHGKIPILPPQIYYADLSSNSFTSSIPSDIGKSLYTTLYFSLSKNGLTGSIPESICNASYLEVLDLSDNNLYGKIPTCMLASSMIIWVNLRMNNLSGPIPDLFPVDCSLKALDLNGNLLTKSIPKSLANCRALEDLDLGNNQMLDKFPMFPKNISSLRVLILQSNKFYGQITCTESIGDWPMIQIVDIASNNFSGELPGKCLTKWHTMMSVTGYRQSQLDHTIPSNYSYEDAVSITNKGLEMQMRKIASNGFTYIDFSNNKFHGEIPKEFGQLIYLHGLNLSNNVLSGQIPSSFGNMRQLESLDLSRNHLSGKIPASLSSLSFLGFLNFSYNQLHGRIPGGQIQLFPADRFQGNQGLCGLPVTLNCPGDVLPETRKANHSISGNNEIEWNLISAEIGFIVGFGTVIGPLVFLKRWRKWYFDRVEDIAFRILPQILLRKWLSWKMGTRRGVRAGGRRAS